LPISLLIYWLALLPIPSSLKNLPSASTRLLCCLLNLSNSGFIKAYGRSAQLKCSDVSDKVHPHLFRHTRAMHLYQGGMPLALLAEWLGHAQLETTLIYAHADTEMKRKAIEKATSSSSPANSEYALTEDWKNDEELLLRLYGLK